MNILVTGSQGFVGKNLVPILRSLGHTVQEYDKENTSDDLLRYTKNCQFVIHLAGVNRPKDTNDFYSGNSDFTKLLCDNLKQNKSTAPILLSSSIQAAADNDYGKSKKQAEKALEDYAKVTGNKIYIYRFKNLYGKWSRPNYNSVVATWCYNISRNIDIKIDNPSATLELCYIDDVIAAITSKLDGTKKSGFYEVEETDTVSLQELQEILYSFKSSREDLSFPDQNDRLRKNLFATYVNYLPSEAFSYPLKKNEDDRGSFTEIMRSKTHGQFSVNISKPGITKGQHWHSTKVEKFLVVHGKGVIRFRDVYSDEVTEYHVEGSRPEVLDIPTGYIHNITNLGDEDMVTFMWASEVFDANKPDTNFQEV